MNPIPMVVADTSATFTATVVIAGVGIVVAMLLLLILVFYAFGKLVSSAESSAKKHKMEKMEKEMENEPSAPPVVKAAKPAAPKAPVVQNGISDEIVAVISAAVAASEGGSAVIRSIRAAKQNTVGSRNPWAAAAVFENTRPF